MDPHPSPPTPTRRGWLLLVVGGWLVRLQGKGGELVPPCGGNRSTPVAQAPPASSLAVVCPGHRHPADPAIASASCVARSPGAVAIAPRTHRFSPTSTLLLLSRTATVAPRYAPGLPIPSPLRGPAILMVLGPPRGCNVSPRSEGGSARGPQGGLPGGP